MRLAYKFGAINSHRSQADTHRNMVLGQNTQTQNTLTQNTHTQNNPPQNIQTQKNQSPKKAHPKKTTAQNNESRKIPKVPKFKIQRTKLIKKLKAFSTKTFKVLPIN